MQRYTKYVKSRKSPGQCRYGKFFGWFKHILKYDFNYYYADDLRKTIEKAIDFYNKERPSFALNYKTPVQYRIEQGFI
ncbi:IS3 family transposase [Carboxydothermus pertinax]|uniref:IS3 family transposase n=1 Tax=Carboxydothermus pertinax TaxID=870242 RepID=UPI0009816C20